MNYLNSQRKGFTFTFHNVSINSRRNPKNGRNSSNLHSTMFLLIRVLNLWKLKDVEYLHSTMFLLIPSSNNRGKAAIFNLHSTMFLLIQNQCRNFKYKWVYLHSTMFLLIPISSSIWQLVAVFTFHNVSINS